MEEESLPKYSIECRVPKDEDGDLSRLITRRVKPGDLYGAFGAPVRELKIREKSRKYHYGNGKYLKVLNVVTVNAETSTHRVETADGKKWIIPPGWLGIELEADEWTS